MLIHSFIRFLEDLCGTVENDISELLFNALDLYKNNQDVFEVICRCTKQLFSNNGLSLFTRNVRMLRSIIWDY